MLRQQLNTIRRYSVKVPEGLNLAELDIFKKLNKELDPVDLEVRDISGGCGSMYLINIISEKFNNKPMIKQHRLVNEILSEEIKNWHGLQLKTKAANKV